MSQTNVKSIFVSATESVLSFVGRIFIMLSMNWKPLNKLADDVSVVDRRVVLVSARICEVNSGRVLRKFHIQNVNNIKATSYKADAD